MLGYTCFPVEAVDWVATLLGSISVSICRHPVQSTTSMPPVASSSMEPIAQYSTRQTFNINDSCVRKATIRVWNAECRVENVVNPMSREEGCELHTERSAG
jgi:hypothetical protein